MSFSLVFKTVRKILRITQNSGKMLQTYGEILGFLCHYSKIFLCVFLKTDKISLKIGRLKYSEFRKRISSEAQNFIPRNKNIIY